MKLSVFHSILFLLAPVPQGFAWRMIRHDSRLRMSSSSTPNSGNSSPRRSPKSGSIAGLAGISGLSTLQDSSTNLMKNCVGAGVFSLSSRVNAISTQYNTLLPASLLVLLMGMWATYNFYILGETCELTNSASYPEAWGNTVSEKSQWIVTSAIVVAPIASCLASTIVLTDILGLVLRTVGAPLSIYGNRNLVITLLTLFILFPLCSLEDLSALKSVSVFGLVGQFVAMATLGIRLMDQSYFPGGIYHSSQDDIHAMTVNGIDNSKWFMLASLLSYCLVSHYNAPRYYSELRDRTPGRFLRMAATSYSLVTAVYIVTMSLGVKLFGAKSQSFILNNFAANDPLATIARIAFGSSVLASFPLIFLSMRNWFVALAGRKFSKMSGRKPISVALLAFISILAVFFKDIGVVGSLAGGILGSSVMFIFPPIMYIRALQKRARTNQKGSGMVKIVINGFLMMLGGLLAGFGTYCNCVSVLKK